MLEYVAKIIDNSEDPSQGALRKGSENLQRFHELAHAKKKLNEVDKKVNDAIRERTQVKKNLNNVDKLSRNL